MSMKRVMVTGMGAITPLGNNVGEYWKNLLSGVSGAGKLSFGEVAGVPYPVGCEVKGFDPLDYMAPNSVHNYARATQYAIAASRQALDDAAIAIGPENEERIGVFIGTGVGGVPEFERAVVSAQVDGWPSLSRLTIPLVLSSSIASSVSIEVGARGPSVTSTAACASGLYSMLEGYHALQRGEADLVLVGGTESPRSGVLITSFLRMGALSSRIDDPQSATRPFSVDRDGFLPGEGACVLTLETEAHAMKRGARIYGELLGGKLTADAFHITAPDPDGAGATRAIQGALENARLTPQDIGVVFAHGTATRLNDVCEAKVLRNVFGSHVQDLRITGIKSMIGHGFGAAGAQSAVAAICALQEGIAPPTINYTPDPEIDVAIVGNTAEVFTSRFVLVNAFGFGGQNVAVLLGRCNTDR